jgi:hypothetical protein
MLGVIVGALIHTENSILNVVSSVALAALVFHTVLVQEFKFPKKGS